MKCVRSIVEEIMMSKVGPSPAATDFEIFKNTLCTNTIGFLNVKLVWDLTMCMRSRVSEIGLRAMSMQVYISVFRFFN